MAGRPAVSPETWTPCDIGEGGGHTQNCGPPQHQRGVGFKILGLRAVGEGSDAELWTPAV